MRIQFAAAAALIAWGAMMTAGCPGDPNDPKTWAKKLKNLRERKEALDNLARMDTERVRAVVPDLMELYKESKNPEHLEALARFKDERTKPLMIEALNYSDEDFDRATVAAGVLGDMKAADAVDPLIKAAEKSLPIKSRANNAKLAAIRALVKIGDKKAVPTLVTILTTSADEQDFMLNQKAALGLAELRDPSTVPALIKGLFMTGRGINIFQESRLALVRIGEPAVDPLIQLLQEKNPEIKEMAVKLKFDEATPGVVPFKAAVVLGDLRAKKAVGPLVARLSMPQKSGEHSAVAIALGYIGTPQAVDTLIGLVKNPKADPGLRASSADGLYLSGDRRAVPVLLDVAKSGYIGKASDLRANAAVDLARIAGKEHFDAFKALVEKETAVQGIFGEALDRMQVAKDCGNDVTCYGKVLADPSWTRAEKAAFAIGFSGDATKGIPLLLDALKPVASLRQERFPVHQAILYSLTRLGTKACAECEDKLLKQIERDEKAVRIPGARDLLAETRVALAVIQNKGAAAAAGAGGGAAPALADASAAADDEAPKAAGGKAGKGAGKAGKAGKGKGKKAGGRRRR
jgi:HEAT repeat protein